jgi:hypothetical protein
LIQSIAALYDLYSAGFIPIIKAIDSNLSPNSITLRAKMSQSTFSAAGSASRAASALLP